MTQLYEFIIDFIELFAIFRIKLIYDASMADLRPDGLSIPHRDPFGQVSMFSRQIRFVRKRQASNNRRLACFLSEVREQFQEKTT